MQFLGEELGNVPRLLSGRAITQASLRSTPHFEARFAESVATTCSNFAVAFPASCSFAPRSLSRMSCARRTVCPVIDDLRKFAAFGIARLAIFPPVLIGGQRPAKLKPRLASENI